MSKTSLRIILGIASVLIIITAIIMAMLALGEIKLVVTEESHSELVDLGMPARTEQLSCAKDIAQLQRLLGSDVRTVMREFQVVFKVEGPHGGDYEKRDFTGIGFVSKEGGGGYKLWFVNGFLRNVELDLE